MPTQRSPVKTIFIQVPSRHRQAVDSFKRETRRTIRSIMLEGIELVMLKHEIIGEAADLNGIVEFPELTTADDSEREL